MNYENNRISSRKRNRLGIKSGTVILASLLMSGYWIYGAFGQNSSLLDETETSNNKIFAECFQSGSGRTDTEKYRLSTECWKSKRHLTPDDLYLTVPVGLVNEKRCSISQTEDDHVRPERGGMYATDLACNFKEQGVYAPDYLGEMVKYKIESIGSDSLLGNFVILSFPDSMDKESGKTRWYFGHTVLNDGWKIGDTVNTGVRFARADLSGVTTGWHTHIELRRMYDGVWQSVRYVTRGKEKALNDKRISNTLLNVATGSVVSSTGKLNQKYYFTHYGLGDPKQNDSSPCISADGKDSCVLKSKGIHTMALTVDIRNEHKISLGDKVRLTGDAGCAGEYVVTDEMACRFRGVNAWSNGPCYYSDKKTPTPKVSNILRPGTQYFIKGDLPGRPGGACSITKL